MSSNNSYHKFNTTINYTNHQYPVYSNYLRGKSVNYANGNNKFGNTVGYGGNKISGQERLSSNHSNNPNNVNGKPKNVLNTFKVPDFGQLNNKLFNFKVENPKIVTIKK